MNRQAHGVVSKAAATPCKGGAALDKYWIKSSWTNVRGQIGQGDVGGYTSLHRFVLKMIDHKY